jgi:hypothetical protein
MEGRERLAGLYGARGWPRKAEQEYSGSGGRAAQSLGPHRHADTLRERDWRPAQQEALVLEEEYPRTNRCSVCPPVAHP